MGKRPSNQCLALSRCFTSFGASALHASVHKLCRTSLMLACYRREEHRKLSILFRTDPESGRMRTQGQFQPQAPFCCEGCLILEDCHGNVPTIVRCRRAGGGKTQRAAWRTHGRLGAPTGPGASQAPVPLGILKQYVCVDTAPKVTLSGPNGAFTLAASKKWVLAINHAAAGVINNARTASS